MAHKYFKRIILIVLDGFGVGAQEDADKFGDKGANTLKSILDTGRLQLPNLEKLGLFSFPSQTNLFKKPDDHSIAGKMREVSAGKDTTTGHWEMMCLPVQKPFDFFPNGFSEEIMQAFVSENHLPGFLGNYAASGTEIIKDLGEEHCASGKPIVYTSADSVFQIAAHEEKFGLQKLYDLCEWTRKYFNQSDFILGRVIARPFVGKNAQDFSRTVNRRDYSIKPYAETVLSRMTRAGLPVVGFGKVPSIYDHVGVTEEITTGHDDRGIDLLKEKLGSSTHTPGLYFLNLNDLDTLYGHRRNPEGYAKQLIYIDERLPEVLSLLQDDDLLMISSDHGNDPCFKGTDHTREFVPLLLHANKIRQNTEHDLSLGIRGGFSDLGASILDNFELPFLSHGKSIFSELEAEGALK